MQSGCASSATSRRRRHGWGSSRLCWRPIQRSDLKDVAPWGAPLGGTSSMGVYLPVLFDGVRQAVGRGLTVAVAVVLAFPHAFTV
eukprot:354069-Chlamydomonas_euryale.AAC.20